MSDDIVTQLREDFCDFGQWENSCTPEGKCPCCLAADEIERLRAELKDADDDFHALKAMFDLMRVEYHRHKTAFFLAIGELSTHNQHQLTSPDMLAAEFLNRVTHDVVVQLNDNQ